MPGGEMNNWWFALVVFGFGLFLAIFIDRLRAKPGPPAERRSRRRWLEYWFFGRFPAEDDKNIGNDAEADVKNEDKPK